MNRRIGGSRARESYGMDGIRTTRDGPEADSSAGLSIEESMLSCVPDSTQEKGGGGAGMGGNNNKSPYHDGGGSGEGTIGGGDDSEVSEMTRTTASDYRLSMAQDYILRDKYYVGGGGYRYDDDDYGKEEEEKAAAAVV